MSRATAIAEIAIEAVTWVGAGLWGGALVSFAFPPEASNTALLWGAVVGMAIGAVRNYQSNLGDVKERIRLEMRAKIERDYEQQVGPIVQRLVTGLGMRQL